MNANHPVFTDGSNQAEREWFVHGGEDIKQPKEDI